MFGSEDREQLLELRFASYSDVFVAGLLDYLGEGQLGSNSNLFTGLTHREVGHERVTRPKLEEATPRLMKWEREEEVTASTG